MFVKKRAVAFIICCALVILLFSIGVDAVNCWEYDNSQATCESNSNECTWKSDPWGSWCEQKGCWNFWTEEGCGQSTNETNSPYFINKSCTWNSGSSGWCGKKECFSYDGTNETACVNNTLNKTCVWDTSCVGPGDKQCWNYGTQATCQAVTGCKWGACNTQDCWTYTAKAGCEAGTGYNGRSCSWNTQYSYCSESGCWDYTNKTGCTSNGCSWSNGYCSNKYCFDFSYTNESTCVNNTANISCSWDSGSSYCNEKGCWNYNSQNNCELDTNCNWETSSSGWCQEAGCWNYDNISLVGEANETACINNTAGLNCTYNDNGGWCFEDISAQSCTSFTSQKNCMDSFYCIWNSTSSGCQDPVSGQYETEFQAFYPGCYIFDSQQAACQNVSGCTWDADTSLCNSNATIDTQGIRCAYINESEGSTLCNGIAMLPFCCKWQGSSCVEDKFSDACRKNLQEPPEGATYCEDYKSFTDSTLCEKIAGDPWYMPCKWDNASERCIFKADKIFTEGKENLMYIDNKKNCEAAGGKWVTDTYCEGSVAVPQARCEFKFDDERNCDKECFACDYKSDKTNWSSSAKAEAACISSKLGICGFTAQSSAANGFGKCRPKDAFVKGVAGNCDDDCGSCTFMGSATASSADDRPSSYCKNSKKGCKWMPDILYPTDESKGRCAATAEKSCEDKCDKCYDSKSCTSYGAKKGDSALAAQCSWDDTAYICSPSSGAGQMELCWDGTDNNNDNKIDCADSQCFSDPFCGGGFFGGKDCFGYSDEASCTNATCAWVNENWGSWCDMPGAACWKKDGSNESYCEDDSANNDTCEWHGGFGGFCEDDWMSSDTCFNLNKSNCQNETNQANNCTWSTDSFCQGGGGYCDPNYAYTGSSWYNCVQHDSDGQSVCEAAGTADGSGNYPCQWYVDTWCQTQGSDAGHCDHKKFSCWQHQNSTACNADTDFCQWKQDEWGSFCESKAMDFGSGGACWNQMDNNSCASAGCNWVSGFCDPKGFGGDMGAGVGGGAIGGQGMMCEAYNGNETGCTSQTGCGWFAEPVGHCDANMVVQCPQFSFNQTQCNNQSACYWNADPFNPSFGFCDFKLFECFSNFTLQQNNTNCESNPLCQWSSWNSCEPKCFDHTITGQNACEKPTNFTDTNTSACKWVNGWCGSAMSAQFFKGMEGGAPIPLGNDPAADVAVKEIDIIDFGMKDMGKAYGFGIRVNAVTDAAMCNGVNLMAGSLGKNSLGGPGGPGEGPGAASQGMGSGKNTTKFYWYLDTDGSRTGNCALNHNASEAGYEFYFRYVASWGNVTNALNEEFTAYRCIDGAWAKTDIKLTSFKNKACSEIGGGMVAVDMVDLEKFPTLYTTGSDIRVYVATAGANNNVSSPSDTADSGFLTPGAVDFDLGGFDMFKYSTNASANAGKGSSASVGYIQYEADCWTAAGCADYACYEHPYCVENSLGVHAAGYEDTRTPKVVGINKETYPDAALISYYTDKPSNGTLKFYKDDASCTTLNATIKDVGIVSADVKDYKLWHTAEIYNDGGINSLNYSLAESTTYYFKIEMCDDGNKCGTSKCSSFITESAAKCAFCKFVTKIDAPSGWNVSYDLDEDGTFEHEQGNVCGTNAGMKTNYTSGRSATVRLTQSDNSSYIEFQNVTLTKTGLTSKTRAVSEDNAFLNGTTADASGDDVGYIGMISDTRDKIVNNMHPENCVIKFPGDGTCDALWHCNDDLDTCLDRTTNATLVETGADYCIWEIPYCDFSGWAGGNLATGSSSSSSSSSGGGGGGGSSATGTTTAVSLTTTEQTVVELGVNSKVSFSVAGGSHSVTLKNIKTDSVLVEIASTPFQLTLKYDTPTSVDVDKDGTKDIELTATYLNAAKVKLTLSAIVRATCTDGVRNQGEDFTDCGGPCKPCPEGAVAGKAPETQQPDEIAADEGAAAGEAEGSAEAGKIPAFYIFVAVLVVAVAVIGVNEYRRRH